MVSRSSISSLPCVLPGVCLYVMPAVDPPERERAMAAWVYASCIASHSSLSSVCHRHRPSSGAWAQGCLAVVFRLIFVLNRHLIVNWKMCLVQMSLLLVISVVCRRFRFMGLDSLVHIDQFLRINRAELIHLVVVPHDDHRQIHLAQHRQFVGLLEKTRFPLDKRYRPISIVRERLNPQSFFYPSYINVYLSIKFSNPSRRSLFLSVSSLINCLRQFL